MIRHLLGCVLLASAMAMPATAAEKAKPKLAQEAKDGVQITQDNITKMKLKKAQQPTLTPSLGGPPVAPAPPPAPPSIN